jgi:hypothetical protein
MARSVTLGTLVTRCQRRCDLQNQDSPSTSDWKGEIHLGYAELYGELAKPGVALFDTEAVITTDGGATYALPDGHLATIGVDYVVDAQGTRRQLAELEVQERNWASGQTGTEAIAYRPSGTNLVLYPTPPAGQEYRHVYVPDPPDLSAASDATVIEMATLDGENFLIWWVTAVVKETIGQNSQVAREEREAARERLQHWIAQRVFNSGRRRIVMDDIDVLADSYVPGDWRYGGW